MPPTPPTTSQPPSPSARGWGAAVLCLAGLLVAWWLRAYEVDDAYIYYRYAHNLVSGHGAVFNPGERLHAIASPLQLALLLPGALVGALPTWGHIVTGATCIGVGLAAMAAISRRGAPTAGLLAGVLLVGHLPLQQAVGMEMPLLVLLTLLAALWWRRPWALAVVLGLLPLARPEGALLSIAGMGWLGWLALRGRGPERRWARLGLLLAPGVALLGFVPVSLYYGSPLPNSLAAKVAQGASGKWGEGPLLLAELARAWSVPRVWPVLLAAALGGWAALRDTRLRSLLLPTAGFAVACVAGWTVLGIPPYRWYFLPVEAAVLLLAATGVGWGLERLTAGWRRPRAAQAVALVATVALLPLRPLAPAYGDPELFDQERVGAYRTIGAHIAEHTPPGASVATGEVGILGYTSQRRVVDLLGIVSPFDPDLHTRMDLPRQLAASRAELFVTNAGAPMPPGFTPVLEVQGFVLLHRGGPQEDSERLR
jgi:hypothetical protein